MCFLTPVFSYWSPPCKPFCAFLRVQKTYWFGVQSDSDVAPVADVITDSDFFEPDPVGLQAGIKIQGLTKVGLYLLGFEWRI